MVREIPTGSSRGIGNQRVIPESPNVFQRSPFPTPFSFTGGVGRTLVNLGLQGQREAELELEQERQKEIKVQGNQLTNTFFERSAEIEREWNQSGMYGEEYSDGLIQEVEEAWLETQSASEFGPEVLDYVTPSVQTSMSRFRIKAVESGFALSDQHGRANVEKIIEQKKDAYVEAPFEERDEIKAEIAAYLTENKGLYTPEQFQQKFGKIFEDLRWEEYLSDLSLRSPETVMGRFDEYGFRGDDIARAKDTGEKIISEAQSQREADAREALQYELNEKLFRAKTYQDWIALENDLLKISQNRQLSPSQVGSYLNAIKSNRAQHEKLVAEKQIANQKWGLTPLTQNETNLLWQDHQSNLQKPKSVNGIEVNPIDLDVLFVGTAGKIPSQLSAEITNAVSLLPVEANMDRLNSVSTFVSKLYEQYPAIASREIGNDNMELLLEFQRETANQPGTSREDIWKGIIQGYFPQSSPQQEAAISYSKTTEFQERSGIFYDRVFNDPSAFNPFKSFPGLNLFYQWAFNGDLKDLRTAGEIDVGLFNSQPEPETWMKTEFDNRVKAYFTKFQNDNVPMFVREQRAYDSAFRELFGKYAPTKTDSVSRWEESPPDMFLRQAGWQVKDFRKYLSDKLVDEGIVKEIRIQGAVEPAISLDQPGSGQFESRDVITVNGITLGIVRGTESQDFPDYQVFMDFLPIRHSVPVSSNVSGIAETRDLILDGVKVAKHLKGLTRKRESAGTVRDRIKRQDIIEGQKQLQSNIREITPETTQVGGRLP